MTKKYTLLYKTSVQELKRDVIQNELLHTLADSIMRIPTMSCKDRNWAGCYVYDFIYTDYEDWDKDKLLRSLQCRKPTITIRRNRSTIRRESTTQYEDHKFYWDEFWKEV